MSSGLKRKPWDKAQEKPFTPKVAPHPRVSEQRADTTQAPLSALF